MKALVVYYSRSGATRKVAEAVSNKLAGDLEEITEKGKRSGVFGFLKSGMEAYTEKIVKIDQLKKDAAAYDLVVIGTPVWAGKMSSPVRSYIAENVGKFKSVAFFVTLGGDNSQKAIDGLAELASKSPLSSLSLMTKEVEKGDFAGKVDGFVAKLS